MSSVPQPRKLDLELSLYVLYSFKDKLHEASGGPSPLEVGMRNRPILKRSPEVHFSCEKDIRKAQDVSASGDCG